MPDEDLELGAEAPEEGQAAKGKGGMMKLIIFAVAGLLILGGGGFAVWKFFLAKPDAPPAAEATAKAEGDKKDGEAKPAEKPGTVINLEPFIVNLADATGKRYLKLTLAVDMKDEAAKKGLEARMPQVRDSILLLLTSKTYADISPVAGKLKLRTEVLRALGNILGASGGVHAVYFTEFVVQ
ncbi:MAG: flagellar basal body-associated FliL family protein [Pseudomonadota bacterium]